MSIRLRCSASIAHGLFAVPIAQLPIFLALTPQRNLTSTDFLDVTDEYGNVYAWPLEEGLRDEIKFESRKQFFVAKLAKLRRAK